MTILTDFEYVKPTTARELVEQQMRHYGIYSGLKSYPTQTIRTRFIGDLAIPEDEKWIGIRSPKGTGKTTWQKNLLNEQRGTSNQTKTLSIVPRLSLGHIQAEQFGLVNWNQLLEIKDKDKEKHAVMSKQMEREGLILCINSVVQSYSARIDPEDFVGCTLILDEAEQCLRDLIHSGILKERRTDIIDLLAKLLRGAGRVIMSDADLSDKSIKFLQALAEDESKPYVIVNDYKHKEASFDTLFLPDEETLIFLIMAELNKGGRPLVLTTSQKSSSLYSSTNLERLLPGKILRIDSETQKNPDSPAYEWWKNPEELFKQYDAVVMSPAVVTGVSLDFTGVFTGVFARIGGTITPKAACQFLCRLREPVRRYIYAPPHGYRQESICEEETDAVVIRQALNSKVQAVFGELARIAVVGPDITPAGIQRYEAARDLWCEIAAEDNAGFLHYEACIRIHLLDEGHKVHSGILVFDNKEIKNTIKRTAEENLAQSEAIRIESILTANCIEFAEATSIRVKSTATTEERLAVEKFRIKNTFGQVTPEIVRLSQDEDYFSSLEMEYYLSQDVNYITQKERARLEPLVKEGYVNTPDVIRECRAREYRLMVRLNVYPTIQSLLKKGWFNAEDEEYKELLSKTQLNLCAIREVTGTTASNDKALVNAVVKRLGYVLESKQERVPKREKVEGGPNFRQTYRVLSRFQSTEENPVADYREDVYAYWLCRDTKRLERNVEKISKPLVIHSRYSKTKPNWITNDESEVLSREFSRRISMQSQEKKLAEVKQPKPVTPPPAPNVNLEEEEDTQKENWSSRPLNTPSIFMSARDVARRNEEKNRETRPAPTL